ncbi:hypothetical protein SAMN04488527_101250 [Aliiroseovarius crassostreae]|uniref:DUF4376 domain-containing protein n=1 Tax=Aliiroseovarius crassostreae TaxID=154981 RepID=A0A0P7IZG6_9RHOB|nr:hypothetical protein [Aliiroseovarius crassostreae]KPN64249.1 hypothetical protein AKJ29_16575 [Aliiroseovarius crassostreae]SFU30925.1 hypothetical protein SAMN04488527_101250 [Aliiroseovarius crassostreae]
MGKRILIERADGSISVADVVLGADQTLEDVAAAITPEGASWRVVTDVAAADIIASAPPTITDVNNEARRRIWLVLGVSAQEDAMVRQQNYTSFMINAQITLDAGGKLSDADQQKREAIIAGYALIESIRAASNVLTARDPIPANFADDAHWPVIAG